MNIEELKQQADALKVPSDMALQEYTRKSEVLAGEMNRIMGARPDLDRLVGAGNQAMMEDNHRNHARFISSLFQSYSSDVFIQTVLWVFRAYRSHGFQLAYWPAQLDTWLQLFKEHFTPETYREIEPFYHFMLIHQADFAALSDEQMGVGK